MVRAKGFTLMYPEAAQNQGRLPIQGQNLFPEDESRTLRGMKRGVELSRYASKMHQSGNSLHLF